MKRTIRAAAFCVVLLAAGFLFLFHTFAAKGDVIADLLKLPAPPPPNPLVHREQFPPEFYSKEHPPRDDAPIEELIAYWTHQSTDYRGALFYTPRPSEKTLDRLLGEASRNPELAAQLLRILPDSKGAADMVKDLYDRMGNEDEPNAEKRNELKSWLRLNSPYFDQDLERASRKIRDNAQGYVDLTSENDILALTRHDFDRASPIIRQLYSDRFQPVSQVLATWALYKHALETNDPADIERYRAELMRFVEDRTQSDGVRDKANDALTHERDFPGRDEWTLSLFDDESLVQMKSYTMLTTLIMYSPPEKYVPKMIELIEKSSSTNVRTAAARNLLVALSRKPGHDMETEIVRSMLPWLDNPKWLKLEDGLRESLVQALASIEMRESVPGLISILNEKAEMPSADAGRPMRPPVPSIPSPDTIRRAMGNANISTNANSARPVDSYYPPQDEYPFRRNAISALAMQKDARAIPALHRVLSEVEGYERSTVIAAILACGGFTVVEQLNAIEVFAKNLNVRANMYGSSAGIGNFSVITNSSANRPPHPITAEEIKQILGQQISLSAAISDELARALVNRIEALDGREPALSSILRRMIMRWQNAAINILFLRDVKRGNADVPVVVRLLYQRKILREKQMVDVSDLRDGKPSAVGIAACLTEDPSDYEAILEHGDAETKTAMLACGRLIRAQLPIAKVAENLKDSVNILQVAAERYLESEDSLQARAIVLARHQNEARIMGATTAFFVEGVTVATDQLLGMLDESPDEEHTGPAVRGNNADIKAIERSLQAEVKKDNDLAGVYSYDHNYIRIYKNRVIYSWDEDDSRYRERPLSKDEFDWLKTYLTANRVDELPPFLACEPGYCEAKELLMLGRNGGRRVYVEAGNGPGASQFEFFAGLEKYFADLKRSQATLKYSLSREVPGLEILLASDELHAATVWKNGADLRVAASDQVVRKKVKRESQATDPEADANDAADDGDVGGEIYRKRAQIIESRRYEGYAWYKVADGAAASIVAQPPEIEFIPLKDSLAVQPNDEQWKARAGNIEIRASDQGIFKATRGKITTLHNGAYDNVVVTPDGRWAVASRSDTEGNPAVVRINLLTNKEFKVESPDAAWLSPGAYIPTINKVLLFSHGRSEEAGDYVPDTEEDATPTDANTESMLLLDPASGAVQPIAGEFRPLSQQTFRPLQKASKPNTFWAAIPNQQKNETEVGIYDTMHFGFKPVMRVPKIKFNSMAMWVDETAGKVYFVYRGHLLALPLIK